jgi:hypothetical protein
MIATFSTTDGTAEQLAEKLSALGALKGHGFPAVP